MKEKARVFFWCVVAVLFQRNRLDELDKKELAGISLSGRVTVGEKIVVKCYPLMCARELTFFLRNHWAHKVLRAADIKCPELLSLAFAWHRSGIFLRRVERKISGEHLKSFSHMQARALGRDLAKWHSLSDEVYNSQASNFFVTDQKAMKRYWRHMSFDMEKAPVYTQEWQALTDAAREWLVDDKFLGDFSTTHGDIHTRNMVWSGEKECFYWIDLEGIRRRPKRHDLAAILLSMFGEGKSWAAIDELEEVYFEGDPVAKQAWYIYRVRWFALINIYRGNQKLGQPASKRLNVKTLSDEAKIRAGVKYLARAQAALSTDIDACASTSLLVEDIICRASVEERRIKQCLNL